jgi:hypothetical protein
VEPVSARAARRENNVIPVTIVAPDWYARLKEIVLIVCRVMPNNQPVNLGSSWTG